MKIEDLTEIGLTKEESSIYLTLIKMVSSPVSHLARRLEKDRTSVYHSLNNLQRKGLVSYIIKNHRKFYFAADPENLLGPIKAKEEYTKKLINEIKNIEKEHEPEQNIEVYEGKEGIRIVYTEIIKSGELLSYGASGKSFDILRYEMPHIIKKAIRKKINGRIITSKKFKNHEMTKVPNMNFKYLDTMDSLSTTTILDDKIAINIFSINPLTIIIRNKELANSYKNYFELLWKIAKK